MPELVEGRVVVNIYVDGTIKDIRGTVLSLDELEMRMAQSKVKNANTRLHLRAHQGVPYKHIQDVSRASAAGGVPTVIFSTYQVD